DAVNGWTFATTTEQEYVLTASQSSGICEHIKTVRVFANNNPTANQSLLSNYDVCKNEVLELEAFGDLPSNIAIGQPMLTTSITSPMSAFVYSDKYSRQQYIFSANELKSLGLDNPGFINQLS